MDTTLEVANKFGVPVAILFFVAVGVTWTWLRLFNKRDGIATMLASAHIEFVNDIAKREEEHAEVQEKLVEVAKRHSDTIKEVHETIQDPDSPVSNVRLLRIAKHHVNVLEKVCSELNLDCSIQIEAMREELKKQTT